MTKFKFFITILFFALLQITHTALAQDDYTIVEVDKDEPAIDLTDSMQIYKQQGNVFIISTVPDASGVVNQIEVHATSPNSSGNWIRFAIANTGEQQIERLIVAPHFRLANSGIWWPDLGKKRISEIVPSEGFQLERQEDLSSDIFSVTLNPGTVVTFIGELASDDVPQLTLWQPEAYKDAINSYTLYEGIIIGIAGLLALFLTIIFLVKTALMFPATALFAWSVLAYVCTDFGFVAKVFSLSVDSQNAARAIVEVFLTISFAIFMFAYLHLNRWHSQYSYILAICLLLLVSLGGITIVSPEFSAGSARIAFSVIISAGLFVILFLALKSFDRAILLLPAWIMMVVWMVGFAFAIVGEIDNDVIQHGLSGALVLILLLISFTVLQHAFAGDAIAPYLISNVERQAVALAGSGATMWAWEIERNQIFVGEKLARSLARPTSELNVGPNKWLSFIHPKDRERFKIVLEIMLEKQRGKIEQDFRIQSKGGEYQWWRIEARPMIGVDGETVRCVGTIRNITHRKTFEENLLFDATHDKLTSLPNIEIFRDRIKTSIAIANTGVFAFNVSLLFIDIDDFDSLREKFSDSFCDLVILTTANRICSIIDKPQDCVARLGHNKFAILIISKTHPEEIARLAEAIFKAVGEKIELEQNSCDISASIGIVSWTQTRGSYDELLRDGEAAMYHAKKLGGGRIIPFQMSLRSHENAILNYEAQLKDAIENNGVKVLYQPIVHVKSRKVAGFEAKLSASNSELLDAMKKDKLLIELNNFVLTDVISNLSRWQKLFANNKIFVSLNINSGDILHPNFVKNVENLLKTNAINPSKLKLEISEKNIMENPQNSISILQQFRNFGVGVCIDGFGDGYSTLAHLGKFSFDSIKISSSYLSNDIENNVEKKILLKYIIAMAHELKLETIGDGVTSEQQFLQLERFGCQYVQGSIFGEDFPVDMVDAILAKNQI